MNRNLSLLCVIAIQFTLFFRAPAAQAAPLAAPALVSGVVADSGHGYPLYARITISGGAAQVLYTDPFTGAYSVNLTQGLIYFFEVEAMGVPDYELKKDSFLLDSANYTRNIYLQVDSPHKCNTPGYARTEIESINFDASNGDFSIASLDGKSTSWQWGVPTSGPGSAHSPTRVWATNLAGNYNTDEYGAITSKNFDLTNRRGIEISWWQWLKTYNQDDYAYVDASNNGGAGWSDRSGKMFGDSDLTWEEHSFPLDSAWAVSNFKLRFRFKSDWTLWPIITVAPGWYIDDLRIITCEPVSGGLVGGYITNANSHASLNGVTVKHPSSEQTATSFATVDDPNAGDGLYFVFVPDSGGTSTSLTASEALYATTSYPISITPSTFNRLDIPLPPNYDTGVSADQISKAGYPNKSVTYNLTLANTGFLPGQLLINPVTLPPGMLWQPTLSQHKTALVPPASSVPVTVTVSIPPFTPAGTVNTTTLRSHWIGDLNWVLPPGAQEIILTTTALNAPPEGQAQSLSTPEETPLDLKLLALDPNGDEVTYQYTQPSHGSLSGTLPYLTYTPLTDYFGADSFTFSASDGSLSSSDTLITIDVTNVNDAPVAPTIQNVEWLAGKAHTYLNPFSDVDGDMLTYSAIVNSGALPAWLSLNTATGEFSGTPTKQDVGDYEIVITADDGHGGTDSTTFTLTVKLNSFSIFLPTIVR